MAKGKWAQGIEPRYFDWIIKDQLAICERPGGFGENHRKVRRQEEIIWIREQDFDRVISISSAPHNLHNYDEMGVRWRHWPFPVTDEIGRYLADSYTELARLLAEGRKLLLHQDEISERLLGFLAGYLVFTGMVPGTAAGDHHHREHHRPPARARTGATSWARPSRWHER